MDSFLEPDTHAIDHKGRIAIPAALRRDEAGRPITRFVLNMGLDGCVNVYSEKDWNRTMQLLMRRVPLGDYEGRMFLRAFTQGKKKVTVDKQGRVPIPPSLSRRASLAREAVVHGGDDHIEIWNPERYSKLLAPILEVEGAYERLAAKDLSGERPGDPKDGEGR